MPESQSGTSAEAPGMDARKARGGTERTVAANGSAAGAGKPGFFNPDGRAGEFFYWMLYCLGAILLGMFFRLRVTGANVVPRKGPFLLIANHQSFLDPP